MRFYMRTGPGTGMSVGLAGGLMLGLLLAATVFWVAVLVAASLTVAGAYVGALQLWRRRRI